MSQLDQQTQAGDAPWWAYAAGALLLWLFLLVTSFITHFFLTALVAGTLERLRGGNPSWRDGLALARQRAGVILGYSSIAATVGLVLSFLREAGTLQHDLANLKALPLERRQVDTGHQRVAPQRGRHYLFSNS